jgi:hypothetical protein
MHWRYFRHWRHFQPRVFPLYMHCFLPISVKSPLFSFLIYPLTFRSVCQIYSSIIMLHTQQADHWRSQIASLNVGKSLAVMHQIDISNSCCHISSRPSCSYNHDIVLNSRLEVRLNIMHFTRTPIQFLPASINLWSVQLYIRDVAKIGGTNLFDVIVCCKLDLDIFNFWE